MEKNLFVLKFGSDSILPEGMSYLESVEKFRKNIGNVISSTKDENDFVIISSGAVKLGRNIAGMNISKQSAASIGQIALMDFWRQVLGPNVGQVLVSYNGSIDFSKILELRFKKIIEKFHKQFIKSKQDKNTLDLLKDLVYTGNVPVINFNDAVDKIELEALSSFQDNDRLFAYIVELLCHLENYTSMYGIIYSNTPFCMNIDGDFHPISSIDVKSTDLSDLLGHCSGKSTGGTGGMNSKIDVGYSLVSSGKIKSCAISSNNVSLISNIEMLIDGNGDNSSTIIK